MALPPRITFPRPPASLRSRAVRTAVLGAPSRPAEVPAFSPLSVDMIDFFPLDEASGVRTGRLQEISFDEVGGTITSTPGLGGRPAVVLASERYLRSTDTRFALGAWGLYFSLHVKWTAAATGTLVLDRGNGTTTEYRLWVDFGGALRWQVFNSDGTSVEIIGPQITALNVWFHVEAGYDRARGVSWCSINRTSLVVASNAGKVPRFVEGARLHLGANHSGASNFLTGHVQSLAALRRPPTVGEPLWLSNFGLARTWDEVRAFSMAASWTPRLMATHRLYMHGEQMYYDVAGTIEARAGDLCAYWGDQSGNDRPLTQASAASRPGVQIDGSLLFDGDDDFIEGDFSGMSTTERLLFARLKLQDRAPVQAQSGLWKVTDNNNDVRYPDEADNKIKSGGYANQVQTAVQANVLPLEEWHTHHSLTATAGTYYGQYMTVDGLPLVRQTALGANQGSATATAGKNFDGTRHLDGWVSDIVSVDGLEEGDAGALDDYLRLSYWLEGYHL